MKDLFCYIFLWYVLMNTCCVLTSPVNTYGSNKTETKLGREKSNYSKDTTPEIPIEINISKDAEHVPTASTTINSTVNDISTPSTISAITFQESTPHSVEKLIPVTENLTMVESTGDSQIKARKGVNMLDSTLTTQDVTNKFPIDEVTTDKPTVNKPTVQVTPSTVKPRKKKPTATVGSEDENLTFHGKKHMNKKDQSAGSSGPEPKLQMDDITNIIGHKNRKSPDYVLPIVLTILAVPLIAIIMAVVYKRGSEWWQHRHYRRMDFLIDGMYNN